MQIKLLLVIVLTLFTTSILVDWSKPSELQLEMVSIEQETVGAIAPAANYIDSDFNPYLKQENEEFEFIDTFSGALRLSTTDIIIPGNGGMDIVIQRSYSNGDVSQHKEDGCYGKGWNRNI